ncbi:MAG TPA: hypothetical protein VHM19_22970 [Polyangiales bacterium]|jgi:hypothetical protein|nr:hypothetical protein [Polyangiales bacterium]
MDIEAEATKPSMLDVLCPMPDGHDEQRSGPWHNLEQWTHPEIPAWFARAIVWLERDRAIVSRLARAMRDHYVPLSADADAEHNAWHRVEARWMRAVLVLARGLASGSKYALGLIDAIDRLQLRTIAGEEVLVREWNAAEAAAAQQADARHEKTGDFIEPIEAARIACRVAALTAEELRCVDACEGLGEQWRGDLVDALFEAIEIEARG